MSLLILLGINVHQMDQTWQLHWYLGTSTTGESRRSSGSSGSLESKDRGSCHDLKFLICYKPRDTAEGLSHEEAEVRWDSQGDRLGRSCRHYHEHPAEEEEEEEKINMDNRQRSRW